MNNKKRLALTRLHKKAKKSKQEKSKMKNTSFGRYEADYRSRV